MAQGVGECNSYESRYRYRWLWPNQLAEYGFSRWPWSANAHDQEWQDSILASKTRTPVACDQLNTILKIAKKRALVDAGFVRRRIVEPVHAGP